MSFCIISLCVPYHVQFSFLLTHTGDGESGKNTGSEGKVSVDDCSMLSSTVVCDGRVKTGPEHPQEQ